MVTLNLSAGAMFSLGLCVGIILGIAGLVVVAVVASKKNK